MRFLNHLMALGVVSLVSVLPSGAQQRVDQKSLEKAKFYEAPRQFQIIDDRPVIHDFREAPAQGQSIEMPAGPGAGNAGGGGGGALAGGSPSLPSGGLPLGNGSGPAYRTPNANLGLPKAGFGSTPSNIPARGMGPRGALPGVTQGVIGNLMSKPKAQSAGPANGMLARPMARTTGNTPVAPTKVASYGGYGTGSGAGTGSSSSTTTNLRGTLLKH